MKRQTKLMSKLLGSSASEEFQQKVFSKIDEARENGSSTLDEDGELLQFAEVDDDIIVEDQANGNELTRISENPENENDLVLSEEVIPTEEPSAEPSAEPTEAPSAEPTQAPTEETKTESENLESIEIERIPGPDGEKAEDIVPDLKVDIIPGIDGENNNHKAPEATYSMKFKNYSEGKARKIAKLFGECVGCIEGIVKDANIDEDVDVKVSSEGEVKVMSVHIGKGTRTFSEGDGTEDLTEVIDDANALAETADAGINAENAEEVRDECTSTMSKIDAIEAKGIKLYSLKSMIKRYSEQAAEVLDADPNAALNKPASDDSSAEPTEAPTEETKAESTGDVAVAQCPETKKWYATKDPEMNLYDSKEEAIEASKSFSEPTVTVTIENLEPASVSTLLAGPSGDEGKAKELPTEAPTPAPLAPAVNPNDGEQGRQFSLNNNGGFSNPLLHTKW